MTDGTLLDRSQREFLAEAGEIVESLQAGLARIDSDRRKGPPHPGRLNEVFRQAHSLKGLAGMFGVDVISKLAHQMETLLDGLRLGRLPLDDKLMEVLYGCTDAFAGLLSDVKSGRDTDQGKTLSLAKRIEDASSSGTTGYEARLADQINLPRESLSALTEYEEHRLSDNLKLGIPLFRIHAPLELSTFEKDLGALTTTLADLGEVVTTLPSTDESGRCINFDVVLAAAVSHEELQKKVSQLGNGTYTLDRIDTPQAAAGGRDTPDAAEAAPLALPEDDVSAATGTMRQVAETVRVDIRKLDELMGIVGELVLARSGLSRISGELKQELGYRGLAVDLHRLVRTLERRIVDLQLAIMQVRMVPLGQVFERMARIVRRTASSLGKDIDLHLSGEETELDKLIVEDLVDPLMHLVRNAVDHGIEPVEQRLAAGKSATGRLELRAYPRGNHVIIDIVDDGRGIDEFAVKRTALERGLVDEEHVGSLSRHEVWNLIFLPGFSTKKIVSDISGRGVGLDVVKTNIGRLSGIIDVDSNPGKGTRFSITLPITLAIIQALIVRSGGSIYALPLASVLEILAVSQQDLCRVEGREMIQIRGQTLPVLRLDRLFGLDTTTVAKHDTGVDAAGFAAVVGLAQHRVALFIDDVVGQQDIVIKSLGAYLSRIRGIAGATHLGDHETILVLDVAALVQELLQGEERYTSPHSATATHAPN
jgi:two-component system chemotaxis sensor kinase CheA